MDVLKDSTNVALPNIDFFRIWGPVYEGLRIVLNSRGFILSPHFFSGISGEAFSFYRRNFDSEYRDTAAEIIGFLKKMGFESKRLAPKDKPDAIKEAIEEIISEIDEGRALVSWNAFTHCEWDVICGYNRKTKEFLGRGSMVGKDDYATADWNEPFKNSGECQPKGSILFNRGNMFVDVNQLEVDALQQAIAHARNANDLPDGTVGYEAFLMWAKEFGDPERLPSKEDQYFMAVYASLHSTAYMFLKEITSKYPKASEPLGRAAFLFHEEASYLQEVFKLVFFNWQLPKRLTPETNEAASELLVQAAENYKKAFDKLEEAIEIIGS